MPLPTQGLPSTAARWAPVNADILPRTVESASEIDYPQVGHRVAMSARPKRDSLPHLPVGQERGPRRHRPPRVASCVTITTVCPMRDVTMVKLRTMFRSSVRAPVGSSAMAGGVR